MILVKQEKLWQSNWLCLDYLYEEIKAILDVSLGSITGWKQAYEKLFVYPHTLPILTPSSYGGRN